MKSGTLCPHQDYVWAVRPSDRESAAIRDYEAAVTRTADELLASAELLSAVEEHPWMVHPEPESVYEDPEFAAAMLVFLKARRRPLPAGLLGLLDVRPPEVPPLDRRWWQVLIQHYLYGRTWRASPAREAHRDELKKELRASGLLWRHELRLRGSRPAKRLLTLSEAKIEACIRINEIERHVRGRRMRQVILCDFVRAFERDRLGAYPIFARLADRSSEEDRTYIALLTGRLAILHRSLVARLEAGGAHVEAEPLDDLSDFCRIEVANRSKVALFTSLLQDGEIRVLVGTRALLGEGWDAPAVNSLILASYAGSFVTTNQMRGRAIRTDPSDPEKVASIWHLVAIKPGSEAGLDDWTDLERRFRAFVGLSESHETIRSGLDRLALPSATVDGLTEIARARIGKADALGQRWREAIQAGTHGFVVPSVRVRKPPPRPQYFFWTTLQYLLYTAAGSAAFAFSTTLDFAGQAGLASRAPRLVLAVGAAAAVIVSVPKLVRAGRAYLRAVPVDGVIRQVAYAVFEALLETGIITSDLDFFDVDVRELAPGIHAASLSGGTFREQSIFADCMDEVLAPVLNPRYIIIRSGRGIDRRKDYHAVPMPLAANKERATCFLEKWEGRMGPAELIYTRTPEGRAALLKARSRSFSSAFVPASERLDRWQ